MKLVTVVTANFNGGKYLSEAVESVLKQTYHHFEYIIVDDGSTDDSRDLIEKWRAGDARIKALYLQENSGVARARNVGIENSTGDYITFLDADDSWMPEKLSKQVAVLEQWERAGLVVTASILIDHCGRQQQSRKTKRKVKEGVVSLYDYINGELPVSINAMTRRECLEKTGLFNPNYVIGEDYELWMRIINHYEYYYIEEPLHCYRLHEHNATRDKLRNRRSKVEILENAVLNNAKLASELGKGFGIIMQRKYNSLGKAYFFNGQKAEAERCFNKALNIDGSYLQKAKSRLWLYLIRGQRTEDRRQRTDTGEK